MKLKYYLRGMGIGIIVTTIILAISFSRREVKISDEDIMTRAAVLGMVMPTEDENTAADAELKTGGGLDTDTEEESETENAAGAEADTESAPETDAERELQTDIYRLVIHRGDVCRAICDVLAENNLVDDAEEFCDYLTSLGYASSISAGDYDIPYSLTMEEVAQVIMAGPLE